MIAVYELLQVSDMRLKIKTLVIVGFCCISSTMAKPTNSPRTTTEPVDMNQPLYVNHPGISNISFLMGNWSGKSGSTLIEECWSTAKGNSLARIRRNITNGKLAVELTILQSGRGGSGGHTRELDSDLATSGSLHAWNLSDYSSNGATFSTGRGNEKIVYELKDASTLEVTTKEADKPDQVISLTKVE